MYRAPRIGGAEKMRRIEAWLEGEGIPLDLRLSFEIHKRGMAATGLDYDQFRSGLCSLRRARGIPPRALLYGCNPKDPESAEAQRLRNVVSQALLGLPLSVLRQVAALVEGGTDAA